MVVALLVLILERTQMIGILKALGLTIGVSVRSFFTMPRTLFFVDCCGEWNRNSNSVAQKYFGIIKLNPENYYVDQAPVYLNCIALLNGLTVSICFLVL
jgi:lipoprotein-releasing system permease protein